MQEILGGDKTPNMPHPALSKPNVLPDPLYIGERWGDKGGGYHCQVRPLRLYLGPGDLPSQQPSTVFFQSNIRITSRPRITAGGGLTHHPSLSILVPHAPPDQHSQPLPIGISTYHTSITVEHSTAVFLKLNIHLTLQVGRLGWRASC